MPNNESIKVGYYKGLRDRDKLNQYEVNRKDLGELIKENQVMDIIELGR